MKNPLKTSSKARKLPLIFALSFLVTLFFIMLAVPIGDKNGTHLFQSTDADRLPRPPSVTMKFHLVPDSDPAQITVEKCCNVIVASFHMEPGTDYTLKLTPDQYTLHGVSDVILMPKPDCYDDRSSITKRFNVLADGNEIINLYIGYALITDCMLAP